MCWKLHVWQCRACFSLSKNCTFGRTFVFGKISAWLMKHQGDKSVTVIITNVSARLWTQHGATCQGEMLIILITKHRCYPPCDGSTNGSGLRCHFGIDNCVLPFLLRMSALDGELFEAVFLHRGVFHKTHYLLSDSGMRADAKIRRCFFSRWPWMQPESEQGFQMRGCRWAVITEQPLNNCSLYYSCHLIMCQCWIWLRVCEAGTEREQFITGK